MKTWKTRSKEEWTAIRPVFLRLYIDENWTLRKVRDELAAKHGFEASEKAFKLHIDRWQARKNYNATEKKDIARCVQLLQQHGRDPSRLTIRNRPVMMERIVRHARDKASRARRRVTPYRNLVLNSQGGSIKNDIYQQINSGFSDTYEQLLRATQYYCRWSASSSTCNSLASEFDNEPHRHLLYALFLFRTPRQRDRGWQELDRVCHKLMSAVKLNSYTILNILITIGSSSRKVICSQLRSSLLRYIRNLSLSMLPAVHPWVVLMQHLDHIEKLQFSAAQMVLIQANTFVSYSQRFTPRARNTLVMTENFQMIESDLLKVAPIHWSNTMRAWLLTDDLPIGQLDLLMMVVCYYSKGELERVLTTDQDVGKLADVLPQSAGPSCTPDDAVLAAAKTYRKLTANHKPQIELDGCRDAHWERCYFRNNRLAKHNHDRDTLLLLQLWEELLNKIEQGDELLS